MAKKTTYRCASCGSRVRTSKRTMYDFRRHVGCPKLGSRRLVPATELRAAVEGT